MNQKSRKASQKKEMHAAPRYPQQGCNIEGHQGYGCNCNPIVQR